MRRASRIDGIYEFSVDGKKYRCTASYRTSFVSDLDKELDIYYKESNPNINQAGKSSYAAKEPLRNLFIIPAIIIIFFLKEKP